MKNFILIATQKYEVVGTLRIVRHHIPLISDELLSKVLDDFLNRVEVQSDYDLNYIRKYAARNEYAQVGSYLEMEQDGDHSVIIASKLFDATNVRIEPI